MKWVPIALAVGAAALVTAMARTEGLHLDPMATMATWSAAGLVALVAVSSRGGRGGAAEWSRREGAGDQWGAARRWSLQQGLLASGVGIVGGLVSAGWFQIAHRLEILERTGVPSILDGAYLLPAVLGAAFVPLPGALALALLAGHTVALYLTGVPSPAAALLAIPLTAAPAEAWLAFAVRRRLPAAKVLPVTGAVVGLSGLAATYMLLESTYPVAEYPVEAVVRLMSGVAAGWLAWRAVGWLGAWRRRAAVRARSS